jgi:CBS domain-containing protein
MTIREIMTEHPRCIGPDAELTDAAREMLEFGVGALPVVDGGRIVGILTDRDIVVRHLASARAPASVESVMTRDPITIDVDQPLERAEQLMSQHQIRRLPVCENDRPIGMITQADIARHASHEDAGALLEAISR